MARFARAIPPTRFLVEAIRQAGTFPFSTTSKSDFEFGIVNQHLTYAVARPVAP